MSYGKKAGDPRAAARAGFVVEKNEGTAAAWYEEQRQRSELQWKSTASPTSGRDT